MKADGFPQWFAQVTPLEEVGLLPIGSRPAKRGLSVNSLDDLRAIPWVFSWSQARINLAGWYGLGTALAAVGDVELLESARSEWPLFATLLDNVEMSLAKTDERIAAQYLALGSRDDLAAMVLDELRLTREWVLKISGNEWPLASKRVLGRAVQLAVAVRRRPVAAAGPRAARPAYRVRRRLHGRRRLRRPAAAPAAAHGERRVGGPAEHGVSPVGEAAAHGAAGRVRIRRTMGRR